MKVFLFLIGLSFSATVLGQSKNYYRNESGKIADQTSYNVEKEKALKMMKGINKEFDLYEDLTELYAGTDSTLFSYKWHFTEDLKKTELEVQSKKRLIGREYPINDEKTLDGKTIDLADLKGKPTLINLWFTSCKPCVEEMPVLNKMKAEYGNQYNFLSITFESEQKVQKFLKKFAFDFDHIVDSKELTMDLGFNGFPVNLFLDKNGILREIKGNVPYAKNESGELKMSDGAEFIKILEGLN